MTSPEPVPPPWLLLAEIVTTEGSTWSATWVTGHALTVVEDPDVALEVGELVAEPVHPPASTMTTSAIAAAAHGSRRLEPCGCFDSVMSAPSGADSEGDAEQLPDDEEQGPNDGHCD